MSERFIDVAGVRLRAVEDGLADGVDGDAVLVLHGFTGDAESMSCVSDALKDHHRVIRLELIGHGGSDAPDDSAPYAMSACARQIVEAVGALGLDRPHLLGYSMGGRAALAAAVANPDRFASLVLVGATAGIAAADQRAERVAADEALADRIEREGLERFVDDWMALPIFASQVRLGRQALARARAQRLRNSERGLASSLRGMGAGAQSPLYDQLASLGNRTLLVVGDEDEKFKAIAANLASIMPDASVAILKDAGHAAHLEAPIEFGQVVCDFFAASRLECIRNKRGSS